MPEPAFQHHHQDHTRINHLNNNLESEQVFKQHLQ